MQENRRMDEAEFDAFLSSVKEELSTSDQLPLSQDEPTLGEDPALQQASDPDSGREIEAFQPNFGTAFDDYGDYEVPAADPVATRLKRKKNLKKFRFPTILKIAIYFVIVVILGHLAASFAWRFADDVLALTRPDKDVEIVINENDSLDDIAANLKENGAIKYEWLFKFYCKFSHSENYFDPGVYTINLTYDYHALVSNLMATARTRETVTLMIAEGSNCYEIFDLLEKNGVCSREKLEEAAANYQFDFDFLKGIPYGASNRLEGFLFPDTYQFYLKDEPQNVLGRLLRNFNSRLNEDYMEQMEKSGYTVREVLTLASIVEAEAGHDNERALIAGVMFNRLADGFEPHRLEMDSTVYYGAMLMGTTFTTELDSPYNTYMYPGIPAGPICNPGLNSIRYVLNPIYEIQEGPEEGQKAYYFATDIYGINRFFASKSSFEAFLASDEYEDILPGGGN